MDALKAWIAAHSKAIASAAGTLATGIAVKLWGHDLDPTLKVALVTAVAYACTYFAPKNKQPT